MFRATDHISALTVPYVSHAQSIVLSYEYICRSQNEASISHVPHGLQQCSWMRCSTVHTAKPLAVKWDCSRCDSDSSFTGAATYTYSFGGRFSFGSTSRADARTCVLLRARACTSTPQGCLIGRSMLNDCHEPAWFESR